MKALLKLTSADRNVIEVCEISTLTQLADIKSDVEKLANLEGLQIQLIIYNGDYVKKPILNYELVGDVWVRLPAIER
jgi:hypothetical protein